MKLRAGRALLAVFIARARFFAEGADATDGANPLQKVIMLLTGLQGKVIADGERQQKAYNSFVNWCGKSAKEKQTSIKEGSAKKEDLQANIAKAQSDAASARARVAALSGAISADEADLKASTLLRQKERQDFEALDNELTGTISMLTRARSALEKELKKVGTAGKASFLERPATSAMQLVESSLTELVAAATVLSQDDRDMIAALLEGTSEDGEEQQDAQQGAQQSEAEGGGEDAAPKPDVYKAKSGGVLTALQSLQAKTEDAQNDARKGEQKRRHNFDLFKQSLEGKLKLQNDELGQVKQDLSKAGETKAQAEKELARTIKDLQADTSMLAKLQHDCINRAAQFQEEVKSRKAELDAVTNAKKFIQDSSASSLVSVSFVQVSSSSSSSDGTSVEAVAAANAASGALKQLRGLARTTGSLALAQLASRASAAMRYALAGQGTARGAAALKDPFAKVKSMITNMVSKLEKEKQADMQQKAFCDKEMAQSTKSKESKEDEVSVLTTRLETTSAQVARLQEELKTLAKELRDTAQSQVEMDRIRREENAAFLKTKKDLEEGLAGVQRAFAILNDYYGGDGQNGASLMQEDDSESAASASSSSSDALAPGGVASSILGLLQVVEADLAKSLSEVQAAEASAVEEYKKLMQENKISTAVRRKETENKNAEVATLRKNAAELTADRTQSQQELDAINEYLTKLKPQCIQTPETYQDRMKRRKAELDGLQQALETLSSTNT
mmetsp:Transcript_6998/g.19891  ORF Transcript_6998/g.19891 Transcript_6998/m.19891 type:complete len:735 (-) Transcript_6998:94-2298(-)